MRFTKPFWAGIADGSVTVAFRRWNRPTVVEGRAYRTGGGRIEIDEVVEIAESDIDSVDAGRAGYGSVDEVVVNLNADAERTLYKVRFHLLNEADPREVLANETELSDEDVAEITKRLDRWDLSSTWGPWTRSTLSLIEANPARRAPDLAEMVGRETKAFKLDVRKLKNIGLTHSLRVGYELSPRGRAYLDRTA